MTVVNTLTGEIVDMDPAAAERRAERITLRLDAIADNYRAVLPMIREAIEKRDDLALGYRSPGDYVSDRFGRALAGLGIEVRRAVVGELTAAGLSTRAIAPVVGVGKSTVDRDLSHVGHLTSSAPSSAIPVPSNADASGAEETTPATVEGEAPARDQEQARSNPTAGEPAPTCERPEPAAPTVTGIDGKEYHRPTPRGPQRKPLTDSFWTAVYDAEKKVESLHRLTQDDRWSQNAEKVAAKHRNDLLRINDLLQQVINALTN